MAGDGREVELKLELSPGDVPRLLEHPAVRRSALGPPRVEHLISVYFDTSDRVLAREGIALRLRRSGGGQVQTVKFGEGGAAGLFARGELEAPVEGPRPDLDAISDPALRARLLELLEGEELVALFETDFRRTQRVLREGTDEWSFDLDQGELRAGDARERICELELELRHGEPARLFELALELCEDVALWPGTRSKAERGYALRSGERALPRKAPAIELPRDASLDVALREVALTCLGQIGENALPAWDGSDPEGVHQMRIGVRRLRSVFSVFRPVLPAETTRLLREPLRWLAGELGLVRDLDVFIDELIVPLFGVRGDDAALKRLRDEADLLRESRKLALREVLRSQRCSRLMLELGHWIARAAWREQALSERSALLFQRADAFADGVLARLLRKAAKLARAAMHGPPASRHELRIALKKLRYACEFFRSLYAKKDVARFLRRLSRLQDLLGALNDAATAGRVLQELLARVEPVDTEALARTAGFIEGFAARQDELALRKLAAQWQRFAVTRPFWERV